MSGTRLLALVLGFWVLMRAVNKDSTGRTLIDHIVGNKASQSPLLSMSLGGSALNSSGVTPNAQGAANPIPGATGGRLDQGFDVTGKEFLSPVSGKVLVAEQTDPGWKGGGYIAVQDQADPNRVYFFAEGIAPTVAQGQTVQAGQRIGIPAINPYNATPGNIEIGRANPANPRQPLAQVTSDPKGLVLNFYNWLRSLGGPAATSTSGAGRA